MNTVPTVFISLSIPVEMLFQVIVERPYGYSDSFSKNDMKYNPEL